tara:strand:+ start:683 stop:1138 length:456 start_codon:yes stop_codon:yes gene_type:complete
MSDSRRKEMFLNAMSRWPAGVTIVTVDDEGAFRGATVSSFTSLSADPAQVIVALKSDSRVLHLAKDTGVFFVSVLSQDQQEVSNAFARYDSEPQVTPHISGAIATFTCSLEEVLTPQQGTHSILVGRVDTCSPDNTRRPLVYWNRNYEKIG